MIVNGTVLMRIGKKYMTIGERAIKEAFNGFCRKHPYLTIESAVEYFAIIGGAEEFVTLDYFESVTEMVENNFIKEYRHFESAVRPSYLNEKPYVDLLCAIARGDGKYYSALKRAKVSESVGESLISQLCEMQILYIEYSREQPLKQYPKQKLKKSLRHYRIQDKLRFYDPFLRFWFGFVFPYRNELAVGKGEAFMQNFRQRYERLRTLVYEQLCDDLLIDYFAPTSPLLSHGSYWNQHSEFDILAVTSNKKLVLGECKYKDRKVCKNELNKLKAKALQSGIKVDIYALFSKDGFSNELLGMKDENLLLFDLNDLQRLCR